MSKRASTAIIALLISLGIAASAFATMVPFANQNISTAGVSLSSSMNAKFICSTNGYFTISVTSVKLEVKNSDGTWKSAGNLPAPASQKNTTGLNKTVDYSSYCTKNKTYRITATFNAGSESVTRTSSAVVYK